MTDEIVTPAGAGLAQAEPASKPDTRHWTETKRAKVLVPLGLGLAMLLVWELAVWALEIRRFILPAPSAIARSLVTDFPTLIGSLWITFRITAIAFLSALVGGVALAVLFSQSRLVEVALFPYAIILQVTPVVSIAPLILIWVGLDNVQLALLILAWIVAFFPILSNTLLGLRSVDHNLIHLFRLYGASRWQILMRLQLPSALPYILGGMKISGGLALIGAVVAEFVAISGTSTGIAWRIIESGNRLQTERMFAALILLSLTGIAIFFALHWLQHRLLHKRHDSAVRREA